MFYPYCQECEGHHPQGIHYTEYMVWEEYQDDELDARGIRAISPDAAAEKWLELHDGEYFEYPRCRRRRDGQITCNGTKR
jgi:hypothetical protein